MAWGNEKHMRPVIAARRDQCADLRKAGHKWQEIADLLGYGSAQHARIDWLRMKQPAQISKRRAGCLDNRGEVRNYRFTTNQRQDTATRNGAQEIG